MSQALFIGVFALFGVVIGSFQNVLISRLPNNQSIQGRSKCESCGHQIKISENIPIFSYLLLGGKCSQCKVPYGIRHLFIELLMPLLLILGFALAPNNLDLLIWGLFTVFSVPLFFIDFKHHKLPNSLTYPLFIALLAVMVIDAINSGDFKQLRNGLIQSASLFAFYLLIRILSRGGMGLGDVKLALIIGLISGYFGKGLIFISTYGAFLLGTIVALLMMALNKSNRKSRIAFGPFMISGLLIGLIYIWV